MNFAKLLKSVLKVAKIAVKAAPAITVAVGAVKRAAKDEKKP